MGQTKTKLLAFCQFRNVLSHWHSFKCFSNNFFLFKLIVTNANKVVNMYIYMCYMSFIYTIQKMMNEWPKDDLINFCLWRVITIISFCDGKTSVPLIIQLFKGLISENDGILMYHDLCRIVNIVYQHPYRSQLCRLWLQIISHPTNGSTGIGDILASFIYGKREFKCIGHLCLCHWFVPSGGHSELLVLIQ